MLVCTRKSDGATFELTRYMDGLSGGTNSQYSIRRMGINTAVDPSTGYGSLTFIALSGILDYGFQSFSGLDFLDCNANLVFEKTGKLRYITGNFYVLQFNTGAKISVSDEYVRTYLHARCDYMSSP